MDEAWPACCVLCSSIYKAVLGPMCLRCMQRVGPWHRQPVGGFVSLAASLFEALLVPHRRADGVAKRSCSSIQPDRRRDARGPCIRGRDDSMDGWCSVNARGSAMDTHKHAYLHTPHTHTSTLAHVPSHVPHTLTALRRGPPCRVWSQAAAAAATAAAAQAGSL